VGPAFDVCFSLVFVKDAVRAALLAAEREVAPGSVYFVSDGAAHTGEELSRVVAALVGRKAAGLKVPRWTVRAAAAVNDVLSPGGSILSRDKARELAHPWWVCSPAKAQAELGFAAEYDLVHGLGETFEWYRREGWL
jgi:nucleoside-diphosphate-sugar epimerase